MLKISSQQMLIPFNNVSGSVSAVRFQCHYFRTKESTRQLFKVFFVITKVFQY